VPVASPAQRTRAVGLTHFGGPEVLGVVELPVPDMGRDDVRIRVRAAAVNPADVVLREGARAAALTGPIRPRRRPTPIAG